MLTNEFKKWLIENNFASYQTFIGKLKRIEKYEGNIDEYYKRDKCIQLLKLLTYSTSDQNAKRNPLHSIPIEPDINDIYKSFYDSTRDYKSRLNKYIEFLNIFYFQEVSQSSETVEKDFIDWMGSIKKNDGENYATTTIKGYSYYLKNISGEFFDENYTLNSFTITDTDSFAEIRKEIKSHSKYKEINERCGKGQLSAGLDKYYEFLAEKFDQYKSNFTSTLFEVENKSLIVNDKQNDENCTVYTKSDFLCDIYMSKGKIRFID